MSKQSTTAAEITQDFAYYPDGVTKKVAKVGTILEGRYADIAINLKHGKKITKKADASENKDAGGAKENKES